MPGANRVVIGLPARYENAKRAVSELEKQQQAVALLALRFGIEAQKAWSEIPLTEDRLQDMAAFIVAVPFPTYEQYTEHAIRDIVVNADD